MVHRIPLRQHAVLPIIVPLLALICIAVPSWAQFETRASRTVPGDILSLAVGDFNRDGKLDVATTGESLLIMMGNGDGTFQPPLKYPGAYDAIAVADFNNDGIPDLVIAPDANSVMVYLGNGDGTFKNPKTVATTDGCSLIAVGDLNGDHKMDLVVIDHPYISVLLGNGDGTFQSPIDDNSFVEPQWLTIGDFNNDHRLDIAVTGTFGGSSSLGMLLGNGDGTFQPAVSYPLSRPPATISAADLNHDGNLDVGDSVTSVLNSVRFKPSSPLVFPAQQIHTTSGPQSVKMTNIGTTAISLHSAAESYHPPTVHSESTFRSRS